MATTANITATLLNYNGQPYTGKTLTFATSLGTLSATSGTTNSSGQVTVSLTSTQFGLAVVSCSWAGDSNVPAFTAYINVHVFYAAEAGNTALPFQVFVEGYPIQMSPAVTGTYAVNYRMLPCQFQIQIPTWDPNITPNGLVGIYRWGVKEYGGVLQRIERTLGEEPIVTLSGVDFAGLMMGRMIEAETLEYMAPNTALTYLLSMYYCGVTAGSIGSPSWTAPPYFPMYRVQGPIPGTDSTSLTVGAPASGDLMIAVGYGISSISETGVTWSSVVSNGSASIWKGVVGSSGGGTTITWSGTRIDVCEYCGPTGVVDQTASNSGSGLETDTGTTAMTTELNELLVGCVVASISSSTALSMSGATQGFTLIDTGSYSPSSNVYDVSAYLEDFSSNALAAESGTALNESASWSGCIATFLGPSPPPYLTPNISMESLQAAIQRICDVIGPPGWVYRVDVGYPITLDFAASFGRGLQSVSFVEKQNILTCQKIVDYSTWVDVLHETGGAGLVATATDSTTLAEVGLLEGTNSRPTIVDPNSLATAAAADLANVQKAQVTTLVLEGNDLGVAPGTFLPEDLVTVTSPTLGLSGSWQVVQITRDLSKPPAYCQLQLSGLVREPALLDNKYRRVIHDLVISQFLS